MKILAMIVLFILAGVQPLSFVTGFIAGMLIVQICFHRFSEPLGQEKNPEAGAAPRDLSDDWTFRVVSLRACRHHVFAMKRRKRTHTTSPL